MTLLLIVAILICAFLIYKQQKRLDQLERFVTSLDGLFGQQKVQLTTLSKRMQGVYGVIKKYGMMANKEE